MIRLNDESKTRINEKDIIFYRPKYEIGLIVITMVICGDVENLYYNNEQLRDKDLELLDKLFDVKSIEDKVKNRIYPDSIDAFNYAMSGIKKECKLVSEGEYDPVKKEEYLTWKDVEQSEKPIKAKLPNGDVRLLEYNKNTSEINIFNPDSYFYGACILNENLFNALMLKKVE